MTLKEAAAKWGISDRQVNTYCKENRISGAERVGRNWVIPADTERPADRRVKSGKYVGFREKYEQKSK